MSVCSVGYYHIHVYMYLLSLSDCDSSSRDEGVSTSGTVGQEIFALSFRRVLNFMLSSLRSFVEA